MSRIIELSEKLTLVESKLATLEDRLRTDPDDRSLQLTYFSNQKYKEELEEKFDQAAEKAGIRVCNYRVIGAASKAIGRACRSLYHFQRLVTLTYSAIATSQPKARHEVATEDERKTEFSLSYVYSGSCGFVLTLPSESLLFDEFSKLDEAARAVFGMAKLRDQEAIRDYARRFGKAVIRNLYQWGIAHVEGDIGVDIDWMPGGKSSQSILVQPQELAILTDAIGQTGDEVVEAIEVRGVLFGADMNPKRFHIKTDDGSDIRGTYAEAIPEGMHLELNARYKATVRKTTTVLFVTEAEKTDYFLEKISLLSSRRLS